MYEDTAKVAHHQALSCFNFRGYGDGVWLHGFHWPRRYLRSTSWIGIIGICLVSMAGVSAGAGLGGRLPGGGGLEAGIGKLEASAKYPVSTTSGPAD